MHAARLSESSSSGDEFGDGRSLTVPAARHAAVPSPSQGRPQREILSPSARGLGSLGPITEERGSQLRLHELDRPSQHRPVQQQQQQQQQQDYQQQNHRQPQEQLLLQHGGLQRYAQVTMPSLLV